MLNLYCEPDENPDSNVFLMNINSTIIKVKNEWKKK